MVFLSFFFFVLSFWVTVPACAVLWFAYRYGVAAQCETIFAVGFCVPMGVELTSRYLYWCPLGLVAVSVEMDEPKKDE